MISLVFFFLDAFSFLLPLRSFFSFGSRSFGSRGSFLEGSVLCLFLFAIHPSVYSLVVVPSLSVG